MKGAAIASCRQSPTVPTTSAKSSYHTWTNEDFMEVQAGYAANVVVGIGRRQLAGTHKLLVGATNPLFFAGVAGTINASAKASRFVKVSAIASTFPLVTLVDVRGFMPGTEAEYGGIIPHGAKLIYAYAEATVCEQRSALITRKAYE